MRWILVVLVFTSLKLSAQSNFERKIGELKMSLLCAQPDMESPVTLNAGLVEDGDSLAVIVKVAMAPGWHIYQYVPQTMPYIAIDHILELPDWIGPVKSWLRPLPVPSPTDPGVLIYEGEVLFVHKAVRKKMPIDSTTIKTGLYYQACDLNQCLPPVEKTFDLTLTSMSKKKKRI